MDRAAPPAKGGDDPRSRRAFLAAAGLATGGAALGLSSTASAGTAASGGGFLTQTSGDGRYARLAFANTFVTSPAAAPSFLTGEGATILIKQTRAGDTHGDIAFGVFDDDEPDSHYRMMTYVQDHGAIATGRWILVSNKRFNSGEIQGVTSALSGGAVTDQPMLQVSPDVNAAAVAIEGGKLADLVTPVDNRLAFAVHDIADIHGGATSYSQGYGRKRFGIAGAGEMLWGADLALTPAASYDVALLRSAPGALKVQTKSTQDVQFQIEATGNANPHFKMLRAGSELLGLSALNTTDVGISVAGAPWGRIYNTGARKAMVIGLLDDSGAVLTLDTAGSSSGSVKTFVARAKSGQTTSIAEFQNNSSTPLLSIAAAGHLTFGEAVNFIAGTTTGTKIGTAASQKLAFWNAAPVVQPTAVADAAGGATVDDEARTALNALLARLRTIGLIAE